MHGDMPMSIWGWDSEVVKRRLLYQYCFTIRNQKRTELKRRYYGCRQCSNSEISSRWKYSTNSSTQTSYSLVSDQDPSPQTNRRPPSILSSASSPISIAHQQQPRAQPVGGLRQHESKREG